MTISENKIYPRTGDTQTVYLKNVITESGIEIGDYTMYNDFVNDPRDFEKNNVLYRYPINGDKLKVGKFCSIACGAKFLFTSANHKMHSISTYPFPKKKETGNRITPDYGIFNKCGGCIFRHINYKAELAALKPNDILMDMYCGTGTIGLTMANHVKKLIGIEIIPQTIDDANTNSIINKITNAEFICGNAAKAAELLRKRGETPDCIVLDPPRRRRIMAYTNSPLVSYTKISPNRTKTEITQSTPSRFTVW